MGIYSVHLYTVLGVRINSSFFNLVQNSFLSQQGLQPTMGENVCRHSFELTEGVC